MAEPGFEGGQPATEAMLLSTILPLIPTTLCIAKMQLIEAVGSAPDGKRILALSIIVIRS